MELLGKLETGMDELQQIVEEMNRDGVAPKQRELLQYVGGLVSPLVLVLDSLVEHEPRVFIFSLFATYVT